MDKITPFGERLLSSFADETGILDKQIIAEKLGFKSEQSIYKVIRGERELNFVALQHFQNYTKRSIDWLLTGEGEKYIKNARQISFDELLDAKIRKIVREELAKNETGGANVGELQPAEQIAVKNIKIFDELEETNKKRKVS